MDQRLLTNHQEIVNQLERYTELGRVDGRASMHGAATASIAVGSTVGVAPGAKLDFYAVQFFRDMPTGRMQRTFRYMARAINEILDANAKLPLGQRVRVIGASVAPSYIEDGYAELDQAIRRAQQEGVLVVTVSMWTWYGTGFDGLDRDPLNEPNDVDSFRPGILVAPMYYGSGGRFRNDAILVPMDSRTTAAESGPADYRFFRQGGESWTVPYVVGAYALACQVKPDVTPEEFLKAARETGSYVDFTHRDREYRLGPILNPVALVDALKR